MANDDEREALLGPDDGFSSSRRSGATAAGGPRQKIKSLYESDQVLGRHSPYRAEDEAISICGGGASNSLQILSEADHIVAVFVVAFDTKAGNVIEWRLPEDVDLDGIEFKAMTSGSHTLKTDFVYFRKSNLFGLACFENMPVANASERGARMKSVGILATSYTLLYRHMQFLETQVKQLMRGRTDISEIKDNGSIDSTDRHQLERPCRYDQLKAFWEDKKGVLPPGECSSITAQTISMVASANDIKVLPAELKVTHPARCFSQFLQFFGHQVFVLWKFSLLGKRILFFSPPPIGVVCYRVYCCCCLASHSMHRLLSSAGVKPHFYINIADIDNLESEMSYIACTTEKIFETKTHLYDVYVDNQIVTTPSDSLKDLLKISDADRDKFQKLNNQRNQEQFLREQIGDETLDEEDVFTSFFVEQNNRLFQTLLDVSMSQDRQLMSDHMKSMGLDPIGDRAFLMELVETYGIDVMLMVDNPCCPN